LAVAPSGFIRRAQGGKRGCRAWGKSPFRRAAEPTKTLQCDRGCLDSANRAG
jgi:hypothetical protein